MTSYDIFTLTTCLVVFIIFIVVCGLMIYNLVKNSIKLIEYGEYDNTIKEEYEENNKAKSKKSKIISNVINGFISLLFIAIFSFSLYVNAKQDSFSETTPTMRVVLSSSMSKKLESNIHLTENNLNDQFQMYDIIFTYKIPDEFELKLYDIVIYEVDETLIVHRIVAIEEPNEKHPEHRYFTLQGDSVGNIDRFPVLYSQMRGIYTGERIRFLGSFILFLQSPAGWLCLTLVLAATFLSPLIDKNLDKKKYLRLVKIGYFLKENEIEISNENESDFVLSNKKVLQNEVIEDPLAFKIENGLSILKLKKSKKVNLNNNFASLNNNRQTFMQKLAKSDKQIQRYFVEINNHLLLHPKVRLKISSKGMSFMYGRSTIAKLVIHGKTLKLYLALNTKEYEKTKYFHKDYAHIKAYEKTPFSIKIKSDRGLKNAKKLIDEVLQIKQNERKNNKIKILVN